MVEIDSSDSSSDEEDRRLKPIRCHEGPGFGSRRVFDASEKPEDSAPTEFFLGLSEEQDLNSLHVAYQKQSNGLHATGGSCSEQGLADRHITLDVAQELISFSKTMENFVSRVKQIPSQTLAAKNLHVGLKLINEYLCTVKENSNPSSNINSNEVYDYTESLQDSEKCDEWFSPVDDKEQYSLKCDLKVKKIQEEEENMQKKDASTQTNISGDVIPREASAALEFFQEIIKNS